MHCFANDEADIALLQLDYGKTNEICANLLHVWVDDLSALLEKYLDSKVHLVLQMAVVVHWIASGNTCLYQYMLAFVLSQ